MSRCCLTPSHPHLLYMTASEWVTRVIEPKGCKYCVLRWKMCQYNPGRTESVRSPLHDQWHQDPKWCSGDVQWLEKVVHMFSTTLLDKHRLKIFAVSFMLSMVPFSHWNPHVVWRNKGCFSCVNIPVRTDSEPVSCKPRNLHPPTCHHIWDQLYTNTKWLIWKEGTTHVPQWAVSICHYPWSPCSTWP